MEVVNAAEEGLVPIVRILRIVLEAVGGFWVAVGFVYAWEGNKKAGKGEQEIKNISENKKMEIEVRFEKPFKGISQAPFTTEAIAANQTKVTWGLSSTMNYPMNVMLVFMNMDKLLGNDMETSLGNLKSILQKN